MGIKKTETTQDIYTAIGLMSGTSFDGVDVACVRTDGVDYCEPLGFLSVPYSDLLRAAIKTHLGKRSDIDGSVEILAQEITRFQASAVQTFLARFPLDVDIDVIGFHGQTMFHDPDNGFTWQIGSGALMAAITGTDVVNDFRSADMRAGGQGAPLIPLYHKVLAARLEKPVAILNIGGVSNITYIAAETTSEDSVIAFDTGTGNALLDDWVYKHTGQNYDHDGALATSGIVQQSILDALLTGAYFTKPAPKSLDRDEWSSDIVSGLSVEDGAATLAAFSVDAVCLGFDLLPEKPKSLYVGGGGRHNKFMMKRLADKLNINVESADVLGWDGDAMEAQGFAYLAVRSLKNLPLSLPKTTGVKVPQTGGVLHKAESGISAVIDKQKSA